mgnify:FL=1
MFRNLLPTSLLGRTILIVLFPIVMFQLIILSYYYNSLWERTLNRLSRSVAMEIQMVARQYDEGQGSLINIKDVQEIFLFDVNTYDQIEFFDETENYNTQILNSFSQELATRIENPFSIKETLNDTIEVIIQFDSSFIMLTFPKDRITTARNHIFLGWQIISALILVLISYLFLKNQVKPISNLAKAAEQFGKGQELDNFKISGALEVRQAGKEFIKMKNRILKQIDQRSLMLAGVSHDLKTPLTRMKLIIETLDNKDIKKDINDEINHMNEMLIEYLDFAASDDSKDRSVINPIEAIIKIKNDVHFRNHKIELEVLNDEAATVNENVFVRSITNILNNAIDKAGRIIIKAEVNSKMIKINIHDNGPGIDDEEKANVFKPFYRIDKSRNQNKTNSGLGLATTKSLLGSINGKISLHDSYLGGLEVAIVIQN